MTDEPDLAKLQETLRKATAVHLDAVRAAEIARGEETAALNAVNHAQKALDAAIDQLRRGAQYETDWASVRKINPAVVPARVS